MASGCKHATGTEAAIARMGELADLLCKCTDWKCADGVMGRVAEIKSPKSKPTTAQMDRLMKIAQRMGDCRQKLMPTPAPTPTATPTAEQPSAPPTTVPVPTPTATP